jgi:parvulin-like peptidyl-prolyl isomerase
MTLQRKKTETGDRLAQRFLLVGALLGLLIALASHNMMEGSRLSEAGAIARINERHIDRTEFAGAYQALLADKTKAPTAADKRLVLDRLIEEELLVQRGLEIGLLEGDAQVRKAVAMAVIEFVLAQNDSDAFEEGNLRRYYRDNIARFTPAGRVQVARIFIPYPDDNADAATRLAATQKLDLIRTELRAGRPFATVAERHGGEILPTLPRLMLTPIKLTDYLGPKLTEAATLLPQGSISDALAGPTGWHFLHIIRNQPGKAPRFETIRPQLIDALRHSRDDEALRAYLDWLRARASIWLAEDAPQ